MSKQTTSEFDRHTQLLVAVLHNGTYAKIRQVSSHGPKEATGLSGAANLDDADTHSKSRWVDLLSLLKEPSQEGDIVAYLPVRVTRAVSIMDTTKG